MIRVLFFGFLLVLSIPYNLNAQVFDWAIGFGGDDAESVEAITIDESGNVYATGYFMSQVADFDPGPDVYELTNSSTAQDVFICKYSSTGELIWAKSIGTGSTDKVNDIAIDQNNNVYITGYFYQTLDFDPGPESFNIQAVDQDAYVLKLDSEGNFGWAKSFGGEGWNQGKGVGVSENGNVYVVGTCQDYIDLIPDDDAELIYDATYLNAGDDFFIVKLDSVGGFLWGHGIGSAGDDVARDLVILENEDVIVTGDFRNTIDFDPGSEEFLLTANAAKKDMFLLKLASDGSYIWANKYGDGGNVFSESVVVDNEGQILVTGIFNQDPVFTVEGVEVELNELSNSDMYLLAADQEGFVKWIKVIHSESEIYPQSVTVDSLNNVFTTGVFRVAADLNPGAETQWETATDVFFMPYVTFVLKLTSTGFFEWAHAIGENTSVFARSIAVSGEGGIFVGGSFGSTQNFAPAPEESFLTITGETSTDAFIFKWNDEIETLIPTSSIPSIQDVLFIYPNPSSSSVFIRTRGIQGNIEIVSSVGQLIRHFNIKSEEEEIEIAVSGLSTGLYFIRFYNEQINEVKKLEKL